MAGVDPLPRWVSGVARIATTRAALAMCRERPPAAPRPPAAGANTRHHFQSRMNLEARLPRSAALHFAKTRRKQRMVASVLVGEHEGV